MHVKAACMQRVPCIIWRGQLVENMQHSLLAAYSENQVRVGFYYQHGTLIIITHGHLNLRAVLGAVYTALCGPRSATRFAQPSRQRVQMPSTQYTWCIMRLLRETRDRSHLMAVVWKTENMKG